MRHRKAGRKFGRSSAHRLALTRNQVTSLLRHGRITTTEAKAKELRRWVDRVITTAKANDVNARRQIDAWVTDREVSNRLFGTYVPRFANRPGGYTRIMLAGQRHGDGAPLAIIEMIGEDHVVTAAAATATATATANKPATKRSRTSKKETAEHDHDHDHDHEHEA